MWHLVTVTSNICSYADPGAQPSSATNAVGEYSAPSGSVVEETNRISDTSHAEATGTPTTTGYRFGNQLVNPSAFLTSLRPDLSTVDINKALSG